MRSSSLRRAPSAVSTTTARGSMSWIVTVPIRSPARTMRPLTMARRRWAEWRIEASTSSGSASEGVGCTASMTRRRASKNGFRGHSGARSSPTSGTGGSDVGSTPSGEACPVTDGPVAGTLSNSGARGDAPPALVAGRARSHRLNAVARATSTSARTTCSLPSFTASPSLPGPEGASRHRASARLSERHPARAGPHQTQGGEAAR